MIDGTWLSVSDDIPIDRQSVLDDLLDHHNIDHTGLRDARLLAVTARSATGRFCGGLHGFSWGGYCEIRTIFVVEDHRGRGVGRTMMEAAETEAIARGCRQIILSTHRFQAPAFYETLGFRRVAELPDCPIGDSYILMAKRCAG
jgi:N-acetylglutamate synthase-like GNAT family acetyltransferase